MHSLLCQLLGTGDCENVSCIIFFRYDLFIFCSLYLLIDLFNDLFILAIKAAQQVVS